MEVMMNRTCSRGNRTGHQNMELKTRRQESWWQESGWQENGWQESGWQEHHEPH